MNEQSFITREFNEHIEITQAIVNNQVNEIEQAGQALVDTLLAGNKILCCGNGGSAGDAAHIVGEMLNRFELERPSLPAIDLASNTGTITAIGNDYSYEEIFAKQIRALGKTDDLLICFTTSGNSKNIIAATKAAHDRNVRVLAILGNNGGSLREYLNPEKDIELCMPTNRTSRIQEATLIIIHCLCSFVDKKLFG